jgi:hypothetical protein
MRRRAIRMSQDQLTANALATASAFQKIALLKLIEKNFHINSINPHPYTGDLLVTMRHNGDSKCGFAVYPNGAASRQSGTIKWDWKRVADSAMATIPDPFVKENA